MKKVYILFSRTDTIPAKAIRLFTPGPFSHISIAIRPDTGGFYSYARRKINNPFISGLISEDTHKNIFAKYPDTPAALYELEVTDEAYDSIQNQICYYWEHEKEATYNFAGMVPMLLGIPIRRKFKFTCSQFVAECQRYKTAQEPVHHEAERFSCHKRAETRLQGVPERLPFSAGGAGAGKRADRRLKESA